MATGIKYQADEPCPLPVALFVGLQGVAVALAPVLIAVLITARASGLGQEYLSWAVFAAFIIAGILTALQGSRFWRLGAGHILLTGSAAIFASVSVLAVTEGGLPLLSTLLVVSAVFYLALSHWLPLLRRVITPVVSGTVLILIAITLFPIAFNQVREAPDFTPDFAGPAVALATLAATVALALRSSGAWRLRAPLIGIGVGCAVAVLLGVYQFEGVAAAPWFGLTTLVIPRFDLTFGPSFWALLPVFLVVILVGGIKNIGDNVAVQQASYRRPRVTDFRLVQGSLNSNGLGLLLCGFAGIPPATVYSAISMALTGLTGVATRRVGYVIGAGLIFLALFPKFLALLLTIPGPVLGAYMLLNFGYLFIEGIRTAIKDGLDFQKLLIVGVAVCLGAGIENQALFADAIGGVWGGLLDNGILIGALAAIIMTQFLELTNPRKASRLQATLDDAALPLIDQFVTGLAEKAGWNEASTRRLRSAAEETLLSLTSAEDTATLTTTESAAANPPRLIIVARPEPTAIELEFMAVFDEENLADRLAYLSEEEPGLEEGEIPLRLLRHYASSVQHQKYHGLDIVTVKVVGARG